VSPCEAAPPGERLGRSRQAGRSPGACASPGSQAGPARRAQAAGAARGGCAGAGLSPPAGPARREVRHASPGWVPCSPGGRAPAHRCRGCCRCRRRPPASAALRGPRPTYHLAASQALRERSRPAWGRPGPPLGPAPRLSAGQPHHRADPACPQRALRAAQPTHFYWRCMAWSPEALHSASRGD